jgi:hypothetical protein
VHVRTERRDWEALVFTIKPMSKAEQEEAAWAKARELCEDWVRDYWDGGPATVQADYYLEDEEHSWEDAKRFVTVHIEPDVGNAIVKLRRMDKASSTGPFSALLRRIKLLRSDF